MEYCPHCMRPASGDFCPNCGGEIHWRAPACQLPVGSLLRGTTGRVYQIGAAKGQGGFGITYAAMDLESWNPVAIKEYFPSRCASRDPLNMVVPTTGQMDSFQSGMDGFLEEGRMLSSVGALPSVVSVRDSFEANGTAYIVMEYVEGVPLHEVVKQQGRMRWPELEPMLHDLLRDLDILHRAGVIHRDISPDNLILTPQRTLKLLDFGSARSIQTGNMTVMLKAGFSPVEQYRSSGQGPFTDVYALASTLYYCLTGVIPPSSADRLDRDELVSPNALGAGLTPSQERTLLWGMAVQPAARPQTMGAFSKALLQGQPESKSWQYPREDPGVQVPPQTKKEKQGSELTEKPRMLWPVHKKKILAALGGVLALAVVIGGIGLTVSLVGGKTTDQGLRYKHKGDSVWITGYKGAAAELTIPAQVDEKPVVCIGEGAFSGCSGLTEVTVPGSVTTIEANAFRDCGSLELVRFAQGSTAVKLDSAAFSGCETLRCLVAENPGRIRSGAADGLPNAAVCVLGEELEQGRIVDVQVSGGIAYAITDLDCAVAQGQPGKGNLPAFLGDCRVFDPDGSRAAVQGGITDGKMKYELHNGQAYLVGYTGTDSCLDMPSEIEGCPVTTICSRAFEGLTGVGYAYLPRSLTRIQAEAFRGCETLRDLTVYSAAQADPSAFADCPKLRCVVLAEPNASVRSWTLSQDVRVYSKGMETGVGGLDYVLVSSDGVIYGSTANGKVLMDIPQGLSQVDVRSDTVWTYEKALDHVPQSIVINMDSDMGFPLELTDRADWEFDSVDDFSCGWLLSCLVCQRINETRTQGPRIQPDTATLRAAMIRAEELSRSYSFTRPSGEKWGSTLTECGVDWGSASHYREKLSAVSDSTLSEELESLVESLVESYSGTDDEGRYYVRFATALYAYMKTKTVYSGSIAIVED